MSESLSALYLSNPALAVALRRRAEGVQMQQQGMDTSPTPWTGALARLAQAYVGTRDTAKADEQIKTLGDEQKSSLDAWNAGNATLAAPVGSMPSSVPAPTVPQASAAPAGDYTSRVLTAEGTGQNPGSSATGHGQFINGTWMAFAKANPELFQGMDPQQILAQRENPEMGRRATQWLADTNGPILRASGVEPTDGAKGLAHFLGAKPAAAVWNADPNMPVEQALATVLPPEQVAAYLKANPNLPGKTAGQVAGVYRAWDAPGGATRVAAAGASPPPVSDAGGSPEVGGARGGPPRSSPLADVYLQRAMDLQQRATQAAASPIPQIKAQAPILMQQAQLYAGLAKEKPKTSVLRPGGMLVDDQGNTIAKAPDDTGPLNVVQDGVDEKGNPRWKYATRPSAVGMTAPTPGPLVNVDQRGLNAESQERGTSLAKQAEGIRNEASTAAGTIDQVRQLRTIGAETDRLASAREILGSTLDALGVKGTKTVRDATNLQQFNGALSGLVLGAQLAQKGVQTEGDANRMREQYARATNTMEANDFLMKATEAQATRKIEQSKFFEDWYGKNKTYDGAAGAWNQFIRDVPLTVRGPAGVVFFNEFADYARAQGASENDIIAQWKARAGKK